MLFRPHQPRRVLGLTFQGLIARRQEDLAASIGAVGDHLIDARTSPGPSRGGPRGARGRALASRLEPKLAESGGSVGRGFLTDERVRPALLPGPRPGRRRTARASARAGLDQGLDVAALVATRVREFSVARLGAVVLEVAQRELRAIEIWGAAIGLLMGSCRRRWSNCCNDPRHRRIARRARPPGPVLLRSRMLRPARLLAGPWSIAALFLFACGGDPGRSSFTSAARECGWRSALGPRIRGRSWTPLDRPHLETGQGPLHRGSASPRSRIA